MKIEGVLGVAELCYLKRNNSWSNGAYPNTDVFPSVEDQTKIIELVICLRRKPANPAGLFSYSFYVVFFKQSRTKHG